AQHRIDSAQARLDDLKKGRRAEEIDVARAQLRQADAERDLAAAQLKRQSGLQQKGLISADQLDQARTQAAASAAHARELEHQLRVSQLAARPDEIAAASQDVKAAEAQLAQAQWSLAQKSVVAPAAGRIEEVYYRVGEFAAAGAPVVSLLPPQNRKLRLFVPETELGRVHAGMTVRVSCDGCGAPFSASIRFIASAAEFTPPVLYDRSQRARLVYLVEAYPQEQDALRLHPGQPVDIELPHG
ncbi:MAG: HlyD family secretion protein, partial [Stenotrophobium sp.]